MQEMSNVTDRLVTAVKLVLLLDVWGLPGYSARGAHPTFIMTHELN